MIKEGENPPLKEILRDKVKGSVSKEDKIRVWEKKAYAPELNEGWAELKGALQESQRELKERFGDKFKLMIVSGSWAKGYAKTRGSLDEKSDIDMITYLGKATQEEKKEVEKILIRNLGKYGLICNDVVEIDRVLGSLREARVDSREYDRKLEDAVVDVTGVFAGVPFPGSEKLVDLQRRVFKEISENPDGRLVWERIRSLYEKVAVALVDDGFTLERMYRNGVTPNYCADIVKNSAGLVMDEFSGLLEIRKKNMSLPGFDEMEKKLAV